MRKVQLCALSEAIKVTTLEKLQIHKVDVLEQDDHAKAGDKVFCEEVRDGARAELELEPVLLVVD